MNQSTIGSLMATFSFLQRFDCFPAIEEMFQKIIEADFSEESTDTNSILIVSFLRSNFEFRDKISNYGELIDKGVDYFKDKGIDPEDMLHGIVY